jgi:hypothetical protein
VKNIGAVKMVFSMRLEISVKRKMSRINMAMGVIAFFLPGRLISLDFTSFHSL